VHGPNLFRGNEAQESSLDLTVAGIASSLLQQEKAYIDFLNFLSDASE